MNDRGQKERFVLAARIIWIAVSMIATIFAAPLAAGAQEPLPQPLVSGMNVERILVPGENHVYTITLQEGAAVMGEADQHGVDLVIDIFGPDGKKITTIDNARGIEGPELIDQTAMKAGLYRLVVHATNQTAKPGNYLMKVNQILGPGENAKRLAKQSYPNKVLYDLWEASLTDPRAVDRFMAEREGKDPVLEVTPVNDSEMQVTYVYLGDADTDLVLMNAGPDFFGLRTHRLGKTNLFFVTQLVPNDARFIYSFNRFETRRSGPQGEVEISEMVHSAEWLLEMPKAPAQPYIIANDSTPKGKSVQTTIRSTSLNEERNITVYTPPGYDGKTACNLMIVFDGVSYGGLPGQAQAQVPTPTILDNLIAEKKIGPTVAVLIW